MLWDHNTGQGHLRSPGEKGKKMRFRAAIHVFRSDFRKEHEKMTLKHFLKRQNRSKTKIRNITVKSRNDVEKVPVFDIFYAISQPFLKIST